MTIVIVSGGFDPLHVGHVRLILAASELGDKLIVLVNNDHWIRRKKEKAFMPEAERCEIIESIGVVDEVYLTQHTEYEDRYDCAWELRQLRRENGDRLLFANGGDRTQATSPEDKVCKELGIGVEYNVGGGKIQSSSWLIQGSR